jgi:hypothetical protein
VTSQINGKKDWLVEEVKKKVAFYIDKNKTY